MNIPLPLRRRTGRDETSHLREMIRRVLPRLESDGRITRETLEFLVPRDHGRGPSVGVLVLIHVGFLRPSERGVG